MSKLLFGTAGVPKSASPHSTIAGIDRISRLGLGCMEMEFVQGVKMREDTAKLVKERASRTRVKLSAHAPYFINLNSHEPEKVIRSKQRLRHAARIAHLCGAGSVVFHSGFYLGDKPQKVYDTIKGHLKEVLEDLKRDGVDIRLRPEVMGKHSEFGSLEEIINLAAELPELAPCIDFSHWHARTGGVNSRKEFASVLSHVAKRLGREALQDMHIHISGIKYGAKGEIKHLNLKESDLNYESLLQALAASGAGGLVICESPSPGLEEDTLLLKTFYDKLR